jgi:hypothetical protein
MLGCANCPVGPKNCPVSASSVIGLKATVVGFLFGFWAFYVGSELLRLAQQALYQLSHLFSLWTQIFAIRSLY